ncbi:MAG TPA: hypothetical protein VLM85_25415, partial [Polyangiaceae bacterium]|nr:hypothetical protein [Polyangiaceae bacterium]
MAAGTISPAKQRDKLTSWSVVADRAFVPAAAACVLGAAGTFYIAGLRATGGAFPVPLDDVFIHFDFARAFCRGHPFEWIAGQGYSSGETSPLYALVLALGYAVGFRAMRLAVWAALVACGSLVWATVSLRTLLGRTHPLVGLAASALLVSVGALDFTLFSGMEVALFAGLLLHSLVLARRLVSAPAFGRSSLQWRLGAWGALLVWTRPEAAVVVFVLAVLAARHARSSSPLAAMVRVAGPGALATLSVLLLNFAATGDFASAGARLKLLSSNPYLSDLDRARELLLNALYFYWKVLQGSAVAAPRLLWLLLACAGLGLVDRRTRAVAGAALASAVLFGLLVSFNGAARYQGFRYYAPSLLLLLVAVGLGLSALGRRVGAWAAVLAGGFFVAGALSRMDPQRRFFAEASENIHDQQVRVGRELARIAPRDARVLVGDAGAIPYVSELTTID